MTSFNFTTVVLKEGVAFIFGSWVYVANSAGDFPLQIVDTRKPEESAPASYHDIDDLIKDLNEIEFSDLIKSPTILTTRLVFSLRCNVNVPLLLRLLISTRN
jgi:hypothetical protein